MVAGGFFTEPQVSVFVKEYATQGVSVMGEVIEAGGLPCARTREACLTFCRWREALPRRRDRSSPSPIATIPRTREQCPDLESTLLSRFSSNVEIFPGDTVVVSKAGIVYVVGDVHRPSGVVMENGTQMTVLQAIAMAEGTNPTAALNSAKIIRKTPEGPKESPLELKKILAAKSPDITLQADDIIFVPGSAAKSAAKRSMEAIIQVATGLAVYRPY